MAILLTFAAPAEDISFNGNAYDTAETAKRTDQGLQLELSGTIISIYFHVDQPSELNLYLKAHVPAGESVIRVITVGKSFTATLKDNDITGIPLGSMCVDKAGYVRVDFEGVTKTGSVFAVLSDLVIDSPTNGLVISHVKDDESNRHYWGRRGPSVHLAYSLPENRDIEWFYNEVIVPEGKDPAGSYFMANGFSEGYFGMQVKSNDERCILFSVWSPFRTDDPKTIPEAQRVTLLARSKDVRVGEFGNEGSGGQSFFTYPWRTGTTCSFLNRAKPDGNGGTIYTGWFYLAETKQWQLIASFRRPNTDKHLTGVHSFLENFKDANGWLTREACYGNQWVRDTTGQWHALTKAKLTGDDIAQRRYRLDFTGGVDVSTFFLRNGGFFSETSKLGSLFTRSSDVTVPPQIDLEKLEGITVSP